MKTVNQIVREYQNRQENVIAKFCKSVTIYIGSGERENFKSVKNLSENKNNQTVEFDRMVDGDCIHMKMSGEIERYEEIIYDPDD